MKIDEEKAFKAADISVVTPGFQKELLSLGPGNKDVVTKYIALAITAMEIDEKVALFWIEKAVKRAGRIGFVRRLYGTILYQNGHYKDAIRELTAANRISGKPELLYMIADSYRGVDNPQKAVEIIKEITDTEFARLTPEEQLETITVYAGARADLKQFQMAELTVQDYLKKVTDPETKRHLKEVLSYIKEQQSAVEDAPK
jgi:tetratricopeptide (TPR) repeat protein